MFWTFNKSFGNKFLSISLLELIFIINILNWSLKIFLWSHPVVPLFNFFLGEKRNLSWSTKLGQKVSIKNNSLFWLWYQNYYYHYVKCTPLMTHILCLTNIISLCVVIWKVDKNSVYVEHQERIKNCMVCVCQCVFTGFQTRQYDQIMSWWGSNLGQGLISLRLFRLVITTYSSPSPTCFLPLSGYFHFHTSYCPPSLLVVVDTPLIYTRFPPSFLAWNAFQLDVTHTDPPPASVDRSAPYAACLRLPLCPTTFTTMLTPSYWVLVGPWGSFRVSVSRFPPCFLLRFLSSSGPW